MNLLQAITQDVEAEWGKVENLAVNETKAAWNTIKAALFGLTPAQWQDLTTLLESEAAALIGHDYGEMVQMVIEWGETKAIPWLKTVEENVLVAAIAAWKASKL